MDVALSVAHLPFFSCVDMFMVPYAFGEWDFPFVYMFPYCVHTGTV
jgi:hypothetical protein